MILYHIIYTRVVVYTKRVQLKRKKVDVSPNKIETKGGDRWRKRLVCKHYRPWLVGGSAHQFFWVYAVCSAFCDSCSIILVHEHTEAGAVGVAPGCQLPQMKPIAKGVPCAGITLVVTKKLQTYIKIGCSISP